MNSWAVSGYPRRTFCPLSDCPSIQNPRITKSAFATCSLVASQSSSVLCTSSAMSDRAKRTFELLRYALGGDAPVKMPKSTVPIQIMDPGRAAMTKAGISRLAPRELAPPFTASRLSYTSLITVQCKAKVKVHGSFRLAEGRLHFTTFQLRSLGGRQCGHRYAFVQVGTYPTGISLP